jgi:hypothetical protein
MMKGVVIGTMVLILGSVMSARAGEDVCFDPLEWAGESKAGIKACEKMAGCEICATDSGAAYGLCLAFCETMECADEEPAATDRACLQLKNTYIQLTGKAALPCEEGREPLEACGSFASCIWCLEDGDPSDPSGDCAWCAQNLRDHGCINVCEP